MSFSKCVFPEKLMLLHEGGSTQELNNFRPISILSIFDKIIEKFTDKRLYMIFWSYIHLPPIKESIDSGKYGCGIFIDLNHDISFKKLEHYGVRGVFLKWFKSYLTDRKQ